MVFQPPQAVKAVHLTDTRAVLPQPLGVGAQLLAVIQIVLERDVPGAQMITLDKGVTRAVAAAAGDERAEKGLGVGIHLNGAHGLAVLVVGRCSAELASRLGTDSEYPRLVRLGAEVQAFVMQPCIRSDEVIIVVVVVLEPFVIQLTEVTELALQLHPALSERDVLKVYETSSQAYRRTGVVAPHEVTAAQPAVDDWRGFIILARHSIDAAVLGYQVGLLDPYPCGMLLLILELAITLVTLIACTGCVTAPNFDARAPSKTLVGVSAVNQTI